MPKKMLLEKYKPFFAMPLHLPDREWSNRRQITKARCGARSTCATATKPSST